MKESIHWLYAALGIICTAGPLRQRVSEDVQGENRGTVCTRCCGRGPVLPEDAGEALHVLP